MKRNQLEAELARKYVSRLRKIGLVDQDNEIIYLFGFELLISSVIVIALTIMTGIVIRAGLFSIGYLLGLIPIRIYVGGYHAESHNACYATFVVVFVGVFLVSNLLQYSYGVIILVYEVLELCIFIYAPIEPSNRPLTVMQHKKYRRLAFTVSLFSMAIDLYCCASNNQLLIGLFFGKIGVIALVFLEVARHVGRHEEHI